MGFFADIAQGLGQSTLNRQQTELLRFLEEERFKRQQEAQIQAEDRASKRQLEAEERAIVRQEEAQAQNLVLQILGSGRQSNEQEAQLVGGLSPTIQGPAQQFADISQEGISEEAISRALNAPTKLAFDVELEAAQTIAEETGNPIPPETLTALTETKERLILQDADDFVQRTATMINLTGEILAPEKIEEAVGIYGEPVRGALEGLNRNTRRKQDLADSAELDALYQRFGQIQSIQQALVQDPSLFNDLPPAWQRIVLADQSQVSFDTGLYRTALAQSRQQVEAQLSALEQLGQGQFPDPAQKAESINTVLLAMGVSLEDYTRIYNENKLSDGAGRRDLMIRQLAYANLIKVQPDYVDFSIRLHQEYGESLLDWEAMDPLEKTAGLTVAAMNIQIPGSEHSLAEALTVPTEREFKKLELPTDEIGIAALLGAMEQEINQVFTNKLSDQSFNINRQTGMPPAEANARLRQQLDAFEARLRSQNTSEKVREEGNFFGVPLSERPHSKTRRFIDSVLSGTAHKPEAIPGSHQ